MLSCACYILIIAIIAAVLGFCGIAGTAQGSPRSCFLVFLVLSWFSSLVLGRRTQGL